MNGIVFVEMGNNLSHNDYRFTRSLRGYTRKEAGQIEYS